MRLTILNNNDEVVSVEGKGSVVLPAFLFMRDVSNTTNNVLLPYTIVPGSSSSGIDNFDQTHENNSAQQQIGDESLSNLD